MVRAASQDVPFLGYVYVEIKFPGDEAGLGFCVQAVVLVVPDNAYNERVLLVIGTDFVNECKDHCGGWQGTSFLERTHTSSAWKRGYQSMRSRERLADGQQKFLTRGQALTVGAHKRVVVWCQTLATPKSPSKAVIEPCGGLKSTRHISVIQGRVTLRSGCKRCLIPVEVTNMSNEPVMLAPETALASVHLATAVLDEFSQDKTPVDEEVVYTQSKADVSEIDYNETELTEAHRANVKGLLVRMSYVFASGNKNLGCTSGVEHEINLTQDFAFKEPYRRVPPGQLEDFRDVMADAGVVAEFKSPFVLPVVLVKKKDKTLRLYVDFPKLNARTVKNSYRIPRIAETLQSVSGAEWFYSLDLQSG